LARNTNITGSQSATAQHSAAVNWYHEPLWLQQDEGRIKLLDSPGRCLIQMFFLIAVFVLLSVPANADYLRGPVSEATHFYGDGVYQVLLAPNYVTVSMPAISFPAGTDIAAAVPANSSSGGDGGTPVVATPEHTILRRLVPRHLYGPQLAAFANPLLQRVTAWGAAKMLNAVQIPAVHRGVFVDLPTVRLEVEEWCSGLVSMKWLLLLATMLLFVGSARWPWKLVLIVAAPLIALEVNMLRVASVGAGIEIFGHASRTAIKEWTGWAATGLGVVQVAGLGLGTPRLSRRSQVACSRRA
jgi:exosortase/archaeosortase family protein